MTFTPTASDFELHFDSEHTFPFLESEDGDYFGYGFQDPQDFVATIREYDTLIGLEDEDYNSLIQYVRHTYAKVVFTDPVDGEWRFQYGDKYKDDSESFKLTILVR